jgi:hypothetical protein
MNASVVRAILLFRQAKRKKNNKQMGDKDGFFKLKFPDGGFYEGCSTPLTMLSS